ncbi:hypothetical protein HPP92_021910 [Vanilla planifolia]|uniref:Coenzyme Q-binding protein COQ10 START domain-containing protein n=1 Tax=Vanilla planifolia TaxID=51239 RepID=A0A835Q2Z0_VANPL|nr:hypothetical protein HPP92_021910 [Vanilla planifolia]
MLRQRVASDTHPLCSSLAVRPSIFFSCHVQSPRKPFLSSSARFQDGAQSFCRRRNLLRSSIDPIEFVPAASVPLGDADVRGDAEEQEVDRDAYLKNVSYDEGFEIEVQKVGSKNRRRIRSCIRVDAELDTVWRVLTDYEGLASFIPSLAVSKLLEKGQNSARLYQVGEQSLALGLKFNAKGVLDCFERDVELLSFGRRREIEFKMIDGDFKVFEGRWSIEQTDDEAPIALEFQRKKAINTMLSYVVEVEPKLWIPVRLLEGRLCMEVKNNLKCVRDEAQRIQRLSSTTLRSWEGIAEWSD